MKLVKTFAVSLLLLGSVTSVQAAVDYNSGIQYPLIENRVFEVLGEELSQAQLKELKILKKDDKEIYTEVIWELYEITEAYQLKLIEKGEYLANLYLEYELQSLEAYRVAELYLEAQGNKVAPAQKEYDDLLIRVESLFDLETELLKAEAKSKASNLTANQLAALDDLVSDRVALRDEIVLRDLEEYLQTEDENFIELDM